MINIIHNISKSIETVTSKTRNQHPLSSSPRQCHCRCEQWRCKWEGALCVTWTETRRSPSRSLPSCRPPVWTSQCPPPLSEASLASSSSAERKWEPQRVCTCRTKAGLYCSLRDENSWKTRFSHILPDGGEGAGTLGLDNVGLQKNIDYFDLPNLVSCRVDLK